MFITTRNKGVVEIVERSEFIKKRKAMAQKAMAAISKNWDYIKNSERIKSRNFEHKEYSTHQKLIDEFKNKTLFESRCFLIGGGPSLKGFDFSQLSNEFTIAINRAHEFIKDPSIIFFIDEDGFYNKLMEGGFGQEALEKFQKSKSLKIALNISGRNYGENIYSVPISEKPEMTFDLKEGLYDGGNSGFAALNLAVCAGIKTIYLLGYDMKGDGKGNQIWFHSGYKQKSKERDYKDWIEDFEKVAPILKNKRIKVINLNPKSELKCFEFGKFKDVRRKTITAITPTGDRPLAFALCQQWMKHQTLKPDQWIVIDDGKVPMKPCISMQYVRRKPRPDDPQHTLVPNLKVAMPLIKGDKIIIIEDDEYYAPGYVAKMALGLDQYEVVGIGDSKYYHLPSGGYFKIGNTTHASLAETGFRSSFLPEFRALLNKSNTCLDSRLWEEINKKGQGFIFIDSDKNPLYLGIKGLSGRLGIGVGHDPAAAIYKRYSADTSRKKLKRWIPKDFGIYMDILKGKLTDKNHESYFPDITGITVCSNTKDLIEQAYNSVRKFHPNMPIIIIDGSTPDDSCTFYVKSLISDVTTVISLGYNIGHGKGMCMGINYVKTKYALIFDSDIKMLKSPVHAMLEMMEEDTFGVGFIQKVAMDGFDYGVKSEHKGKEWMPYLHPYFQLINIKNYKKFHPYVHHGAPCYLTMRDIYKQGLSDKILKEFLGLGHSANQGYDWKGRSREYIQHDCRGTRKDREQKGLPTIEGEWVYK